MYVCVCVCCSIQCLCVLASVGVCGCVFCIHKFVCALPVVFALLFTVVFVFLVVDFV